MKFNPKRPLSRRRLKTPKRQARSNASAKRIVILGAANCAAKRKNDGYRPNRDARLNAILCRYYFKKPSLGLDFTQNQAKFNRRRCIIKNKFAKDQKWRG